jgi:hypothetical protein
MNIYDDLIQVLKKNIELSKQILHRNEKEKFQGEISKLEQLKQVEINLQTEDDELWQSDELKNIEKETKNRKSELESLRAASRELEEATRLMKVEEEEIAQLKRALAAKEDNQGSSKTRARSSEKMSSRQEDKVYEEEDELEEYWDGNVVVEETSSEEELELLVRRSSTAKRNASESGSPNRRLVPVGSTYDEEDNLQSLRSSRPRSSRRKLSSASLPEEDFMTMRSAKARMARRNLSSASLQVHETEDEEWNFVVEEISSEEELELPVRRSSTAKREASGLTKRRLVLVDSTDDEEEDLRSLRRLRTSRRKLSSASLPEEDFMSMRSAKATGRMARRNLSSASHETEDDCMGEEDDYTVTPLPPIKSLKTKRKPQTSSGNVDDLMAQFQGFAPMGMGSPHGSGSSNSGSGSPIYIIGSNPYIPPYGGSISPPIGPYGYGLPGSPGISSIVYSNVGNNNSVRKVYRK